MLDRWRAKNSMNLSEKFKVFASLVNQFDAEHEIVDTSQISLTTCLQLPERLHRTGWIGKKDFSRSRCQQVKLLKRVYFSRILPTYPSILPYPFFSWSSWSSVPSAAKILDPPFWYFFNVIIVNCDHSRTIPLKIHSDTHSNTSLFDPKNASRFCRKFGSGC